MFMTWKWVERKILGNANKYFLIFKHFWFLNLKTLIFCMKKSTYLQKYYNSWNLTRMAIRQLSIHQKETPKTNSLIIRTLFTKLKKNFHYSKCISTDVWCLSGSYVIYLCKIYMYFLVIFKKIFANESIPVRYYKMFRMNVWWCHNNWYHTA